MATQDRAPLTDTVQQHAASSAGSLVARQLETFTASGALSPTKDTALCDTTSGSIVMELPLGDDAIVGLPLTFYKTAAANTLTVQRQTGSGQTIEGATSVSTTGINTSIAVMWDGTTFRRISPPSNVVDVASVETDSLVVNTSITLPASLALATRWTSQQFTEAAWAGGAQFTIPGPSGLHAIVGGVLVVDVPAVSSSGDTTGAQIAGAHGTTNILTGGVGAPAGPVAPETPGFGVAAIDTSTITLEVTANIGDAPSITHLTGRFRLVLLIIPVLPA